MLALILAAGLPNLACASAGVRIVGAVVWDKIGSPYNLSDDLVIAPGSTLTIKPGVTIKLSRGTSLIVEGDLRAIGSPSEPILFTSASANPAPGDWGSLRFATLDTTLSYDESGAFIKGSRLDYCIIEYGGTPAQGTPREFLGGAIHCRKSSPYFTHLTLRHNFSLYGGGIYCHEFASPYIEDCLFLENRAQENGGGLACFFYSNAIIKRNVFQANTAGEHGGGIYFSFSSPQISGNLIENNSARYQGGGLYGSNTVTGAVSKITGNVLLSNESGRKAHNLFVTAKMQTVFRDNVFFSSEGFDVSIDALDSDLDFVGNYFGPLAAGELETHIRDGRDAPGQKMVLCDPPLELPPSDAVNVPLEVTSFQLHGDPDFSTDWPYPLCLKAPIYLEVQAADRNPYHADWVAVRLRSSSSDSRGVVALAWETEAASGIYRLTGSVRNYSSAKEGAIRAAAGENLIFSLEDHPEFEISCPIEVARSYITDVYLVEEADSLHVVDHSPVVGWKFRNILGQPQKAYKMQLGSGVSFMEPASWESGEKTGRQPQAAVAGARLADGEFYTLRVSMTHSSQWSDWAQMTLRLNSLPTSPQPSAPPSDQVVKQTRPALKLQGSSDAEGDPIVYEIQICQDSAGTAVLAMQSDLRAASGLVSWAAPIDLLDNAQYFWRARANDNFETGKWTPVDHFYVNLVEEAPLPFALLEPKPDQLVYQLQPAFSCEKTTDPDPLSSLRYRLLVSANERFSPACTLVMESDQTSWQIEKPLKNDASYFWRVDAIDNTGSVTPSMQIGRFSVSTTPSQPLWRGPMAGEELKPDGMLMWGKSTDPDPKDVVRYRIQIAEKDFSRPLLDETLGDTSAPVNGLKNYALLSDDREYRIRVRAEDGQGVASNWSQDVGWFFFNQVNTPPRPVGFPILPDSSVVSAPLPEITWRAASDPDKSDLPSSLDYLVQFDRDGAFPPDCRQIEVKNGEAHAGIPDLTDNTKWFYRICARDDEGALSAWSPAKSFILNLVNDPPSPFELAMPLDSATTYQLTGVELSWQYQGDIDPGDKIHYLLSIAPADGGAPVLDGKRVDGTTLKTTALLKNETAYLWWVEAQDLAGARTPSAKKYFLSVNTTPSAPKGEPVTDGIMTGKETLRWLPATDPDPADVLSYHLQIVTPDDPQKSLLDIPKIAAAKTASGVGAAELKGSKNLKDNQLYAFRVRAIDPHGAMSNWSEPTRFALDLQNEAPAATAIREPSGGLLRNAMISASWSAASDPDPVDSREGLVYRLQAVRGSQFTGAVPLERVISNDTTLQNLELGDNQLWTLRLRAEDSRGGKSAWSTPVQVVVNAVEDPPSAPEIRSPSLGAVIHAPNAVVLTWSAAKDPDYKAVVKYQVRYWPADQPDKAVTREGIAGLTHRLAGLQPDQAYNWEVTAVDDTGLKNTSAAGSFTYHKASPPPAPQPGVR